MRSKKDFPDVLRFLAIAYYKALMECAKVEKDGEIKRKMIIELSRIGDDYDIDVDKEL